MYFQVSSWTGKTVPGSLHFRGHIVIDSMFYKIDAIDVA